ncbi:MAG: DUF262 domain-containing protein [Blastocatellia bacterium]|nr:DUF262 domain-containing protein [Blastocatellia bacterium]
MQKPERSSFTSLDFLDWQESGSLIITPKFQRRGIWQTPARSYLIDTILRGMPIPPIFLRVRQSDDKKKLIREVIDGQQRIAAVVDYVNGKYPLSSNLGVEHAGKYFEELPEDNQDRIRQYSFICEVFSALDDVEILQIFARLNTYSVPLNAYPNLVIAETAVLGSMPFRLWHNPSQIVTRSQGFIVSGLHETIISSNLTRLHQFAAIRHRIAHAQEHARAQFDTATMSLAARRYKGGRPGKFLRDWESPTRRWLNAISDELKSLSTQITP